MYANANPTRFIDLTGFAGIEAQIVRDSNKLRIVDDQLVVYVAFTDETTVTVAPDRGTEIVHQVGRQLAPLNRAAETGARTVGVVGLGVAATMLALAPEPTGTTKLAAGYLGLRAVDEGQALVRGAESEAHKGIRMGLEASGVDSKDADLLASGGLLLTDSAVAVAGFRGMQNAQRTSEPIEGVRQEGRTTADPKATMEPLPNREGAPAVTRKIPREKLRYRPKERGRAPIGEDNKPVELHHLDQDLGNASPRAEMTRTEHRGGSNFKENHPNTGQKPSKVDRVESSRQHRTHWENEWDAGVFDDLPVKDE
jgi:hypothetical protein